MRWDDDEPGFQVGDRVMAIAGSPDVYGEEGTVLEVAPMVETGYVWVHFDCYSSDRAEPECNLRKVAR